jgi:hypothetical protein
MPLSAEEYLLKLCEAGEVISPHSHGLVTIDFPHERMHDGDAFICSYKSPNGADIADDSAILLALITGNIHAHTIFSIASGGDAELFFHEDATFSNNGTVLPLINKRRDSANNPLAHAYITPTVSANGLQIFNTLNHGGTGPAQSSGSSTDHTSEWILKKNTNYLFRFFNRAGSAQPMCISVEFYEHSLD